MIVKKLEKMKLNSSDVIIIGDNYEKDIKGTTAGLVIGDRAFKQRLISPYIYDLGLAWKEVTGLPFVFAAWVSNKEVDADFVEQFNRANKYGLERLEEVVEKNTSPHFDLRSYYTKNIEFELSVIKLKSVKLFIEKISKSEY